MTQGVRLSALASGAGAGHSVVGGADDGWPARATGIYDFGPDM
ncbi:MAG TPA: hypothetical protein PLM52_16110 [Tabrizicola sp.]|nr:hypothetical protein [Tabrizicola sp.]